VASCWASAIAPQGVVHPERQGLGDVEHGVPHEWGRERGGAIEATPGDQQASGRTGIGAAVAQQQGVAQARLVLAAACDPRAGGGGLERQAAPPRPGERGCPCVRPHPGIEGGERGAGLERGRDVGDPRPAAGPARHRRQNRQNRRCGGLLAGAGHAPG